MKQFFILPLLLGFLSCSHLPSDRQVSSLNQSELDNLWVVAGKNKRSQTVRSNVVHFWAWMAAHAKTHLGAALAAEDEVTADPHYFNFRDVHAPSGANGYALVDVDDSGRAPLFLDFVRYSLFVKYYFKEINLNVDYTSFQSELYHAYLQGLDQNKRNLPPVLNTNINQSRANLENQNTMWVSKKLVNSASQNFKMRKDLLGLVNLSEVPAFQEAGQRLKNILVQKKAVAEIYDSGYMTSDSGGSRGLARFWFSTLTNNKVHQILECKELVRPGADYYEKQAPAEMRVQNSLRFYADVKTDDSYVMNETSHSYWCRPREFEFLKRHDIESLNSAELKDFSLYIANWLGTKQALQPSGPQLNTILRADPGYLFHLNEITLEYEAEMSRLMSAGH